MSKCKLASLLILEKNGKVLLLRRYNTGYEDGNYSLPAGKVDNNESFLNAIIRESNEEINVVLDKDKINSVCILHRNGNDGTYWVDNFFLCRNWSGDIKNMEPEKCDDLQWFDIGDLPENMVEFVRYVLEEVVFNNDKNGNNNNDSKNTKYIEYGWKAN